MFLSHLIFGTTMIVATAMFHVFGLIVLSRQLQVFSNSMLVAGGRKIFILLGFSVLAIFAIHTVELWAWAAVYLYIGEFSELSTAFISVPSLRPH